MITSYRDEKATVLTDEESDTFEIKKGTKQGDPLSSLLFNTILQKALEEDIPRWQKKRGMGIHLSDNDHDSLTNMRFAASSKEQLQKKLCEFKQSTEKVGLRVHPRKTKILSNQSLKIRKEIEIDDIKSRNIYNRRKYKILGSDDNFPAAGDDRNQKSNQGCQYRQELTSRNYMLRHRRRLFDAVVTPTMNYASGTSTLTKEHRK